jgi:hypothetical protein
LIPKGAYIQAGTESDLLQLEFWRAGSCLVGAAIFGPIPSKVIVIDEITFEPSTGYLEFQIRGDRPLQFSGYLREQVLGWLQLGVSVKGSWRVNSRRVRVTFERSATESDEMIGPATLARWKEAIAARK